MFLIVLVTALVATMMATPIYRATLTLKIEREASKVIDFKGSRVDPEEIGDIEFYRTQYELLKSRTLAERVVEQLNLRQRSAAKDEPVKPWWSDFFRRGATEGDKPAAEAPAPDVSRSLNAAAVRAFLGSLTVEPIRNSRLVRVLFDSADPRLASDALTALAQNYIAVNLERRYEASSYAKTFLEEKLAQTKAKLEDSERALVEFQREQQIINVDEKQNMLAQTLASYNAAAAKAGEDRLKAEALYREFRENPESSPHDDRQQVDGSAARAADQAAGRVPGPVAHLQAGVSQDAAAEGVDRRDRQEDQGRVRHRAAGDRGHVQGGGAAGSERRGQARVVQEGRARPAGPQHPLQHPQARGRHQPPALRRAAAAAEGSRRRGGASAPTT